MIADVAVAWALGYACGADVNGAANDGEFSEGDHPRDADGKFIAGGGSGNESRPTPSRAEQLYGDEIKGVKGQKAVNALFRARSGHVKDAVYCGALRSGIDLIWGNRSVGLCHIWVRHQREGIDGLIETLQKGELAMQWLNARSKRAQKGKDVPQRILIRKGDHVVILSNLSTVGGKQRRFVVTSYDKWHTKRSRPARKGIR